MRGHKKDVDWQRTTPITALILLLVINHHNNNIEYSSVRKRTIVFVLSLRNVPVKEFWKKMSIFW